MTISLQSDLCAPGKLSLASAPSVGRDPFLSFSEKVKLDHRKHRHRHKLKLYGYFSWSSPFQLQFGVPDAQAASSLSLEPTENEDVPLIFFDGDNGGDDNVAPSDIECHTLRLNKLLVGASSSGGQRGYGSTSSGGLVQWGFSMGLGVGPPSISTWQRALRNIFVAVLCLAAAVAAIVWYQRRMHKIEMENMGDMLIPLVSGGSGDIRPGALPHGVNAQIQYGGWTNPVARTVSRENA
ncbi:hypothetical protein FVE85_8858 [Porphyridium purpureum]|uniref:Uncharacterized protein n=1 Tax=Porphyridium purpureum TaxID=35688 RepID=A0A5J4YRK1_PORPP|nr:hypothetical protein FVE85_8858 [Porphyridium purpureum]|eukprot:POR4779..scf296_7